MIADVPRDRLKAIDRGGQRKCRSPEIKDYILKYQVTADDWYSAYPNTTVKQIKKGQREPRNRASSVGSARPGSHGSAELPARLGL